MDIFPAFATPIANATLPGSTQLNNELRQLLLQRESEGNRYRNPHASMHIDKNLFESDFNLFAWPEACIRTLRGHCWTALSQFIAGLNGFAPAELNEIEIKSHTWFHITRRGGWFGLHNHPMASWSGVYCVAAGVHDADRPQSGLLRFHAPHANAGMFRDSANVRLRDPFSMRPLAFRLEAGQLMLFPSWLFHEVLPFEGEGERITIAFNCWFNRKGQS
jgi:uncharacterized protein (TIGR02466 family)